MTKSFAIFNRCQASMCASTKQQNSVCEGEAVAEHEGFVEGFVDAWHVLHVVEAFREGVWFGSKHLE